MSVSRPTRIPKIVSVVAAAGAVAAIALFVVIRRAPPGAGLAGGIYWAGIEANISREFPDVRQLDTGELAAWLDDAAREKPLVIDVRTADEYSVSHLPGAVHAETADAIMQLPEIAAGDRPVVVYCSVGWRSSVVADALRKTGRNEVWNLRGSIFRWGNEGRLLECRGAPVHVVHPYDGKWGVLLNRDLWPEGFAR